MRDPRFDRSNAYVTARRNDLDSIRKDAEELPDFESIVSSLTTWCRDVLFHWHHLQFHNGDHRLSDLLTLPSDLSPVQAFQDVSDAGRRQLLAEGFSALLERK